MINNNICLIRETGTLLRMELEKMVYLNLDKEFVDKNLKKWNEESISESGEDGKDSYLIINDQDGRIEDIDEDASEFNVVCDDPNLGFISLDVKLDSDSLLKIIELSVKKLNKFKTVLESLK